MEDVNNATESQVAEQVVEETTVEEGNEESTETQAGSKTDPNLLLKALKDEREKRREEERKRIELEKLLSENDGNQSDEGRLLNEKITSLEAKISLKEVTEKFPALKD